MIQAMIRDIKYLIACFLIFTFATMVSSCEKAPEKRIYAEIVIKPAAEAKESASFHSDITMPQAPISKGTKVKLSWKLPVDWVERTSSGMRLATFSTGNGTDLVECTIVSLGSQAGSLQANVERWMRQINLPPLSQNDMNKFLSKQEKLKTQERIPFSLIDFTALQEDAQDSSPSIIAVILFFEDSNIFVKMTGNKVALIKNKEKFRSLCQSLKVVK